MLPAPPNPRAGSTDCQRGQIWLECLIGCVLLLMGIVGVALVYVKRYQSYRAEITAHPLVGSLPSSPRRKP